MENMPHPRNRDDRSNGMKHEQRSKYASKISLVVESALLCEHFRTREVREFEIEADRSSARSHATMLEYLYVPRDRSLLDHRFVKFIFTVDLDRRERTEAASEYRPDRNENVENSKPFFGIRDSSLLNRACP